MGAQNGSYRERVAATPLDEGAQITPSGSFQEITLEATSSYFYLNVDASNCLYATSSKNNNIGTGTQSTAEDNGMWSISVNASGVADIIAQGTNSRNEIRYNSTNTRFSCYASTSDMEKPAIYRKTAADATVWNLKSIAITTAPDKDEYVDGDVFDPTGMVVTATYEDNAGIKSDKEETVSNSSLTASPTILKVGDTKVTLSFGNKTVDVTGLTVTVMPYSLVSSPSQLQVGVDYYIGGSTVDKYSDGAVGLWKGTVSGTQCVTVDKTFTSATGSFNNVTDAELIVLEAVAGETDTYYIKVKSSGEYLYNATTNNLSTSSTNKTAWTIGEIEDAKKNGMYLQSTTCKISSNGSSNRLRAYTSGTYKGIFFFKKN